MLPLIDVSASSYILSTGELATRIRDTYASKNMSMGGLSGLKDMALIRHFTEKDLIIKEGTPFPDVMRRTNKYYGNESPEVKLETKIQENKKNNIGKQEIKKTIEKQSSDKKINKAYIFKKLRSRAKRSHIIRNNRGGGAAQALHTVNVEDGRKHTPNTQKVDHGSDHKKIIEASTQTHTTVGKSSVPEQSMNWWSKFKNKLVESPLTEKFKKNRFAFAAIGATLIAGFAISTIGNKYQGNKFNNYNSVNAWDSRSAYLPNSYKRGYNDIKQGITDFGSRVHLAKTVNKIINRMTTTTRHNYTTTIKAVNNSNISLLMHKNAINHMRY